MAGVSDANATGSPDEAVALNGTAGPPSTCAAMGANVIVCARAATMAGDCETAGAGAYCVLPDCVATSVHVPPMSGVTLNPLMVQTAGVVEATVTGKPEE